MNETQQIKVSQNPFLSQLQHIPKPPQSLFYLGTLPENKSISVAIVGSRKPTRYGKEVTAKLSADLAKAGITIISGLALGIDSLAHKAALEAGGETIAVLGNGLNKIYPSSNRDLAEKIIQNKNAILSEYQPAEAALPYHFLERNRIVSGLADAVLVVEAAKRSGTLNTVSHALEQGKEIFAVPGNITSPLSEGCNNLIKQGATPVQSATDILEIIAPNVLNQAKNQQKLSFSGTTEEEKIMSAIKAGLRTEEEILKHTGLEIVSLSTNLTMLEVKGFITKTAPGSWGLK